MEFTQEEIKVLKLDRMTREICSLPKEKFPEYLFNPIHSSLAYDDENYHSRVKDNSLKDVMKLKRRYNNFFQWLEAEKIYGEYRSYIEENYGPFKKIRKLVDKGILSIFLPPEPKLKKSRENRALLESGMIPSQQEFEVDFKDWARRTIDAKTSTIPAGVVENISDNKAYFCEMSKEEKANAQKAVNMSNRQRRISSVFIDSASAGMNIANEFYSNNGTRINKEGKEESQLSLGAAVKEYKRRQLMADYELEDEYDSDYVFREGRWVEREKVEQLETLKALSEEGWDISGMLGNANLSNASMKMLRNELGVNVPMSKKELKKWKKNKAKQDKALAKKRQSDSALLNMLTESNKMHRILNEDEVLDLTFDSYYND